MWNLIGFLIVVFLSTFNKFEQIVGRIFPAGILSSEAGSSDVEASFWKLNLYPEGQFLQTFAVDGEILVSILLISYFLMELEMSVGVALVVYLFLILFILQYTVVSSQLGSFNKVFSAKVLKQGYRHHKHRKVNEKLKIRSRFN